jgi:hypothetical protein
MSLKTHKSEYTILSILALATVLVVSWLFWRGMVQESRAERARTRTTRSANEDGLLACYMLFERLRVPLERSDAMLLPNRLEEAGVVFLIDPMVPVAAGEVADLRAWVARGGVLITTEIMEDLGLHRQNVDKREPPDRRRPFADNVSGIADRRSSTAENARSQPLARDVLNIRFKTDNVFNRNHQDPCKPSDVLVPLFTDNDGLRIAEHRLSRGRIVLLSDSSFLANGRIASDDNSVLAANLVSYAVAASNGRKVLFDEYHYGYRGYNQGLGVLAGLLFTTSAGWTVLTLTAAGLLLLLYKGRQFGPRHGFGKQRRRSKMEHVYAVGATYRAAGAHHLALRLIYGWFRQRVTAQTGLAAGTPNRLVAEALARRDVDVAKYQHVLDECDGLAAQAKVTQRQLVAAVEQLAWIEKETLNGSGDGKRSGR